MKIEFIPSSKDVEDLVEMPVPAKICMPEWYKKIKAPPKDIDLTIDGPRKKMINLKSCTPFMDGMTSGFVQRTWTDLNIKKENGELFCYTPAGPEMIGSRERVSVPLSNEYVDAEFYWTVPWIPKVPKGYSVLLTQPINRVDSPITSLSAVIDADEFYHVGMGQYPCYLKKDFEGLIPAGTPMYQIIPFKRDSWKSEAIKYNETDTKKREFVYLRSLWGIYKSKFWKRKTYE